MPASLERTESLLLQIVRTNMEEAERLAGANLYCHPGCTECCIGPFPINMLDALRLQRGMAELYRTDPERFDRIRDRAEGIVAFVRGAFPGDRETGVLNDDGAAAERFATHFETLPCPALDSETGLCDLYAWRPIACRTFGPPVRFGDELLPPCRLCYKGATADEIKAGRVAVDPDGIEDVLLDQLAVSGLKGHTIVAYALAREYGLAAKAAV